MINLKKIALTVRAAIETALDRCDLPSTESAVRLLLMIAAHESGGFTYCRQGGNGPAIGLFQMEAPTYKHVLEYLNRTGKFPAVSRQLPFERMLTDATHAAAIARVYLYTFPEPLPAPEDLDGLAAYAKKYWNTTAGKATEADYKNAFIKYVWQGRA